MALYGELLDTYDPEVEYIYSLFIEYFGNTVFTKIKEEDKYMIYMCKVYSLLSNQYRYLIAVVNSNKELKEQEFLNELKWVSFQTRSLPENHKLKMYSYVPKKTTLLNSQIVKVVCNNVSCSYSCSEIPIINITLLNTKDDMLEYQHNGTVISALETYQTIITFNKNV